MDPLAYLPNPEKPAELRVPLTSNVIHRIERGRDGGGVEFELVVRAELCLILDRDGGRDLRSYPQPAGGEVRVTYPAAGTLGSELTRW